MNFEGIKIEGITETKNNYMVDLDVYQRRDRYYTGSWAGQIVLIDKVKYPDLLAPWNDYYDTKLDMMIAAGIDGHDGVKNYRKGYVIQ